MLNLSPSPRNRLYTDLNSYTQFLGYVLGGRFINSKKDIDRFEHELRLRFSSRYAICVSQCRIGIYFAVKALIKPGQEVILSPYTIADVINMVIFAGGRPVFADVDRSTCNISATDVESLITANTGAVLITHLHGVAAEAHRIKAICDRSNIPMIEDCAQSFGVKEQGKPVGTIGEVGIFSLEMHKNLPTWRGGVVVTERDDVMEKIQAESQNFSTSPLPLLFSKLKSGLKHDLVTSSLFFPLIYPILRFSTLKNVEAINKSTRRKPQESEAASELPDVYKSYYTSFQARIGLSQLKQVDTKIEKRIEYGRMYHEGLKDIDELILPPLQADKSITYLWYPLQCPDREALRTFMFEHGRDIALGHFINNADTPRFEEFYRDCPNARQVAQDLLYLPTYPSYSRRDVEKNIEVIRLYFNSQAKEIKPEKIKPEKVLLNS
ncbi:MAG TPA: DegT/DnrJ/EryC1/StrS aminotransferase family protein [Coleofasciculaceae cyanobacterium]|jgi:dTDP-4-amino-4,6-dideoxygalactose transaminase